MKETTAVSDNVNESSGVVLNHQVLSIDARATQGIRFVWTKNPLLLHQYFDLRSDILSSTIYEEDTVCDFDQIDLRSHFILALDNHNDVVGGARLCLNDPILDAPLPSELDYHPYKELFPDLNLEAKRFGDVTRFILKPEYANDHYSIGMYKEIIEKCIRLGLDHIFINASLINARRYKAVVNRKFGIPFEITTHNVSETNKRYRRGIDWYICIFHKENPLKRPA